MSRSYAYVVSAGMLGLTLAPLFRGADSFPLSTYPMFSYGQRDPMTTVERAVGVGAGGARRPIPPRLVGSGEVLQAKATVAHSIRLGGAAARALCRDIAERVSSNQAFADVVSVEIRTDTFDAVAFFNGHEAPVSSRVHARCKVARR
jgi:hypothetical protein